MSKFLLTLLSFGLCLTALPGVNAAQDSQLNAAYCPTADSLPPDELIPVQVQRPVITGVIRGIVTLQPSGTTARNVVLTIAELKKSVLTDENGAYEFKDIPAGKYQIIAHLDRVPDVVKTINVTS